MEFGLSARVALVCGGSKGLGLGCARALADEGAIVALAARNSGPLEEAVSELGGDATAHVADMSSASARKRLVSDVLAAHGKIDVLVTNSGGPRAGGFEDVDDEAWDHAYDVVLKQVVHMVQMVVPGMRKRGWGRILNVVSSSWREPIQGLVLSNAFRPAVVGLAKTMAREFGPHGITVNNLAPGRFGTERLRHLAQLRSEARGGTPDHWMDRFGQDSALGRIGTIEEFGLVAAFLASDAARFVTGITLPVDGGLLRSI